MGQWSGLKGGAGQWLGAVSRDFPRGGTGEAQKTVYSICDEWKEDGETGLDEEGGERVQGTSKLLHTVYH